MPFPLLHLKVSTQTILLPPGIVGAALLAVFGSQFITFDARTMLLISGAALLLTALIWTRRQGLLSPIPLVALGLLFYFPVRGLIQILAGLTTEQAVNPTVIQTLTTTGPTAASLDVLIIGTVFAVVCEVMWQGGWITVRPRVTAEPPFQSENSLGRWAGPLLIAGAVGILLQVPTGVGYLQGDEASGGFLVQVIYLLAFAFSLGVIFAWRPYGRLPFAVWILLAAVSAFGFYMGRKETLFLPLLALVFAGATTVKAKSSKRRVVVGLLVASVLIFLVFPAVTTYRREIMLGSTPTQAITDLPGELATNTAVTGVPRTGGVVGYVGDCLLYLTNRLHGFDSILLATGAPPDTQILNGQSLALSPLGLVIPSGYWASSTQQVGLYFGVDYWRSDPANLVSVAPTIFGQVHLAFGTLAVVPTVALFAILAGLAAKYFRSTTQAGRGVSFVFMTTALLFERDALYLIISTERRLALLGLVVAVAAMANRHKGLPLFSSSAPAVSAGQAVGR